MSNDSRMVVSHRHGGSLAGTVWFFGWLFTLGYLHLHFGKGLLAIVLWPYYLGVSFAK